MIESDDGDAGAGDVGDIDNEGGADAENICFAWRR